jgi:hypothetical protein
MYSKILVTREDLLDNMGAVEMHGSQAELSMMGILQPLQVVSMFKDNITNLGGITDEGLTPIANTFDAASWTGSNAAPVRQN